MYLKKILRFRLPDDIVSVLNTMKRKSDFVRDAIREKNEKGRVDESRKITLLKFSIEDIKKSACSELNQHLFVDQVKVKKSKYRNKKCVVDDIEFHSIKEADRYKKLKILLKAGEIGFLELQKPFELNPGGSHSLKYFADFVYMDSRTGEKVVEDVKPMKVNKKTGKLFRTQVYLKKKKLMRKVHNIEIIEI